MTNEKILTPTTTISTIVVQSANTKLILALLKSEKWLQIKILEMEPNLAELGDNLEQALALQDTHKHILTQLQNKQSPVEELLKQADHLVKSKDAKSEIYAEMADNLNIVWKDINTLLNKRNKILDLNVSYHNAANDYFQKIQELVSLSEDKSQRNDIDETKIKLNTLTDIRRNILEYLKITLRIGSELLIKLKEIENDGLKLDSRPEKVNFITKQAIAKVEKWFEIVGQKRKYFENIYYIEKAKLERHLSLSIFDKELNDFENRIENYDSKIKCHSKQFSIGNTSFLNQSFVNENESLLKELNSLREYSLRLTYSIEQTEINKKKVEESRQFEQFQQPIDNDILRSYTDKSYRLLDTLNSLITFLSEQNSLILITDDFFIENNLIIKEITETEENLRKNMDINTIQNNLRKLKNEKIEKHFKSGKSIIESFKKLSLSDTNSIENLLNEIEEKLGNLEININNKLKINNETYESLMKFYEKFHELYDNLERIENDFINKNNSLGDNLISAKEAYDEASIHLNSIQKIGIEINELLNNLPEILDINNDNDNDEIKKNASNLHNKWGQLKNKFDEKLHVLTDFIKSHSLGTNLINELNKLNEVLKQNLIKNFDENYTFKNIEENFSKFKVKQNEFENFASVLIEKIRNYANQLSLEVSDSINSVKSIVDLLVKKQNQFEQYLKNFSEFRELSIQWDKVMEESLMIVNVATKLRNQLYPIVAFEFNSLSDLINELKRKLNTMLPQLEKVLVEIDSKIHETENLSLKSKEIANQSKTITGKLKDLRTSLQEIITEYSILLKELIEYFLKLQEFDRKLEFEDLDLTSLILKDSDLQKNQFTIDLNELEQIQDNLIRKIQSREPISCAEQDTNVLISVYQEQKLHLKEILEKRQNEFDKKHQEIQFESNLHGIYKALDQLTEQLIQIKSNFGDTYPVVKNNCQIFQTFEKTTEILNEKIINFCNQERRIAEEYKNTKLNELNQRWQIFDLEIKSIRDLLNKALYYFDLIEQAQNWIDNGNGLLNEISEKANLICTVEEAKILQNEIENFLQPGEQYQNERINEIAKLALELFNESKVNDCAQKVIDNNKNVMTSFAKIENDLHLLALKFQDKNEENSMSLPEFLIPLTNIMLRPGDILKLECHVKGDPDPFIKWSFNGELIKDSDNIQITNENGKLALIKTEVTENDEGYYTVHARNRMGDVNSSCNVYVKKHAAQENEPIEIKQAIKPKIQSPLKDLKVTEGDETCLECIIVGEPEPEVIWYHNSSLVKESPDVKLQFEGDKCSLILKSVIIEDTGCYKVVAINSGGEASSQCHLTVEVNEIKSTNMKECLPIGVMPVLNRSLLDTLVDEGKNVVLECNASYVEKFKWFHNHQEIHENDKYKFYYDPTTNKIALKIFNFSTNDVGEYSVYLANKNGQIHNTSKLNIKPVKNMVQEIINIHEIQNKSNVKKYQYEIEEIVQIDKEIIQKTESKHNAIIESGRKHQIPRVINGLTGKIVDQGANVTFDCTFDGYPSPIITWKRNGVELETNDKTEIKHFTNKTIMELNNVTSDNSGQYICVLSNFAGTVTSAGDLLVKKSTFPPVFGRRLQAQVVKKGNRAIMEVEITGIPEPTVNWFKDNTLIKKIMKATDFKLNSYRDKHQLIIYNVGLEHSGQYMVKAENSAGEAQSIADFAVFEPTPENMVEVVKTAIYESTENGTNINNTSMSESERSTFNESRKNIENIAKKSEDGNQTEQISSKAFEENRLYFVEKISQNQIDNKMNRTLTTKATVDNNYSNKKTFSNVNSKMISKNARIVSPRLEAIEMEKLWATSNLSNKFEQKDELYQSIYESKKRNDSYGQSTPDLTANKVQIDQNHLKSNIRSQSESGYMADTEDIQQQFYQKNDQDSNSFKISTGENVSEIVQKFESEKSDSLHATYNISSNINKEFLNESQMKSVKNESQKAKATRVASPSKFIKTNYQETDYESEYMDKRIPVKWCPNENKAEPVYKSVKPILTSQSTINFNQKLSTIVPPTEFDDPPKIDKPPRPKFEPIDKPKDTFNETYNSNNVVAMCQSQVLYKPKPVNIKNQILYRNDNEIVLKPGSPPEILFMEQNKPIEPKKPLDTVYYRVTTSQPLRKSQNADTSNYLQVNESFENSYRTMSLQQTKKFSKFENNCSRKIDLQITNSSNSVKKPKKFIPGELRESDYESELESIKIKPIWNPNDNQRRNEPFYRPVKAPMNIRSSSVPVPQERVLTPMQFDTRLPEMPSKISTNDLISDTNSRKILKTIPKTITTAYIKKRNKTHSFNGEQQYEQQQQQQQHICSSYDYNNCQNKYNQIQRNDINTSNMYREETQLSQKVTTWSLVNNRNKVREFHDTPPSIPTTPVNYQIPKNPPYFITPLRDIAVLRGRTARFECIVQSDQTPLIIWSVNGEIIDHCKKYDIYYRNGVCRLTISNVLFDDSGNYLCTANNQLGSVNTSGNLQVKDDKRYSLIY